MCNQAHILKFVASHKEKMSPLMILVRSRYEKMQEVGLIKFSPVNTYLKASSGTLSQSTGGLIPDLCPEVLSGCVKGQQTTVAGDFILAEPDGKRHSFS